MAYSLLLDENSVLPEKIESRFSVFHLELLGSNHSGSVFMTISQLGCLVNDSSYTSSLKKSQSSWFCIFQGRHISPQGPGQHKQAFLTPCSSEQDFFLVWTVCECTSFWASWLQHEYWHQSRPFWCYTCIPAVYTDIQTVA